MAFMRVLIRTLRSLAVLAALATPAGAQPKPADPPAPAKTPSKADDKAEAAKDAGGDAKAEDEKDKKPTLTPGYSWSDKPAKKGKWRPRKQVKFDPNTPIATYPGFRMLADGSSQVWVQVTRKVSVTAPNTSGMPTFVLAGAQVAVHNNTNALVTEYFDTPLARAKLKADAGGAQLVLELRENVAVKQRIVDGPRGSMVLYIDLPKAQKSYSERSDFVPEARVSRTGKTLPPKGGRSGRTRSSKRGPSQ